MEYQVPQFIEVEDKIVGPLTLKQFIYIAGTVGLCVLVFAYLPIIVAVLISIPIVALGGALTFYKVNNKPFVNVLEAGFNYYTRSKLFLWKHEAQKPETKAAPMPPPVAAQAGAPTPRATPRLTRGKLSELAWSLDVPSGGGPTSSGQRKS